MISSPSSTLPTPIESKTYGRGLAYVKNQTGNIEITFYFMGIKWRIDGPSAFSDYWLIRSIDPPLPWLLLRRGTPKGDETLTNDACTPLGAIRILKEQIFLYRYLKSTPIFDERDTTYRRIVKRMEETPNSLATGSSRYDPTVHITPASSSP